MMGFITFTRRMSTHLMYFGLLYNFPALNTLMISISTNFSQIFLRLADKIHSKSSICQQEKIFNYKEHKCDKRKKN